MFESCLGDVPRIVKRSVTTNSSEGAFTSAPLITIEQSSTNNGAQRKHED